MSCCGAACLSAGLGIDEALLVLLYSLVQCLFVSYFGYRALYAWIVGLGLGCLDCWAGARALRKASPVVGSLCASGLAELEWQQLCAALSLGSAPTATWPLHHLAAVFDDSTAARLPAIAGRPARCRRSITDMCRTGGMLLAFFSNNDGVGGCGR